MSDPCNCKEEGSPDHFSACEKYMKFSDRDPGALRSRLRKINEIVQILKRDPDDYPQLSRYWINEKVKEIERLSEVDDE